VFFRIYHRELQKSLPTYTCTQPRTRPYPSPPQVSACTLYSSVAACHLNETKQALSEDWGLKLWYCDKLDHNFVRNIWCTLTRWWFCRKRVRGCHSLPIWTVEKVKYSYYLNKFDTLTLAVWEDSGQTSMC